MNETQLAQQRKFMIEVALRDARHLDVIAALDRLVVLPTTEREMKSALADMKAVMEFINKALPKSLHKVASELFVEHGDVIKDHYSAIKAKRD